MASAADYENIIAALHVDATHNARVRAFKLARTRLEEIDRDINHLNAMREGLESIIKQLDVEEIDVDHTEHNVEDDEPPFLDSLDELEEPPSNIDDDSDWSIFNDEPASK